MKFENMCLSSENEGRDKMLETKIATLAASTP